MGDAPSPPPKGAETEEDHEQAPEPEQPDEPREVYPFVDAAAVGSRELSLRAGWAEGGDGDVVSLVYEYTGPVGSAATKDVLAEATDWHAAALDDLQRRAAEEQQRAAGEPDGEQ